MQFLNLVKSGILKSYQMLLNLWLTFFLTNSYSLGFYGEYSAKISVLFLSGFVYKLGFDMLFLKENNKRRLFEIILPTYILVFLGELIISLVASFHVGYESFSALAFSTTLVIAEMLRRKNSNGLFIFMSGGVQYTLQSLLFLNDTLASYLGTSIIILTSVTVPLLFLCIYLRKVLLASLFRIRKLNAKVAFQVLKESLEQVSFNASIVFNNWLGIYLLSLTGNMNAVGIYSAVKRLNNGLSLPEQVLNINLANPLARSLNNPEKLTSVLRIQRKLFFYTALIILTLGISLSWFLPKLINLSNTALASQGATVHYILLGMVVINVLTGPTFMFTRMTEGLRKKTIVVNIITTSCYLSTILFPLSTKLLVVTCATFLSMTLTNIYLVWMTYRDRGLLLHAIP